MPKDERYGLIDRCIKNCNRYLSMLSKWQEKIKKKVKETKKSNKLIKIVVNNYTAYLYIFCKI